MSSRALRKGVDYQRGSKYQTLLPQRVQTLYRPAASLVTSHDWIILAPDGALFVNVGYCWDGPSGPTIDTASTMRASLAHDALYQLMREELLDVETDRGMADDLLMQLMIDDGAWRWRARLWLWGVRRFAKGAAR